MRFGLLIAAMPFAVFSVTQAMAFDIADGVTISGYLDARAIAPAGPASWLEGGLGKFRYGGRDYGGAEGVLQASADFGDGLGAVTVLRAEPRTPGVVDALETYLRYAPASEGDVSWSVKAGAFFPTISLENDDLGWASSYTLTPSAINSWIGEELRTIGSEGTLRWKTDAGTLSLIGAVMCCNDETGILMADRGWSLSDRPTGLFERVRLPDATLRIFRKPVPGRTGMFDEIDGRPGWYAGATWQMPEIGKISVVRYDNAGDPYAASSRDPAWNTRFWSVGARAQVGPLMLIAQGMRGSTIVAGPGFYSNTKFQSAFALASYDLDDDWRISAREDVFATRRAGATNNTWSEDGDATTGSLSWAGLENIRLTAEVIFLRSRRGEYAPAGLGLNRNDTQFQLDSRFFF